SRGVILPRLRDARWYTLSGLRKGAIYEKRVQAAVLADRSLSCALGVRFADAVDGCRSSGALPRGVVSVHSRNLSVLLRRVGRVRRNLRWRRELLLLVLGRRSPR